LRRPSSDSGRRSLAIVCPDEDEYYKTIEQAAARGFLSGRVYDALLLQCAAKVKAETIYTWNLRHFRAIRPDAAGRMRTP
jgi:hypothetical protein